jgi:hypothetical protein
MIGDTLFTQIEVGQSDKKAEAWAMSLKAAMKSAKEQTISGYGLALTQPFLYDNIKQVIIYDEKFFVDALCQN